MAARLLGIDIGTTSVKAQALSDDFAVLGSSRVPYGATADGDRFEQDSEAIWQAVEFAIQDVASAVNLADVAGIGVDGQAPTTVLVSSDGRALTPLLGWRDVRAGDEAAEMSERFPGEWRSRSLNSVVPVAGSWPPARSLWFARHEPELHHAARYMMSIKDFVVFRLTGAAVSDPSNARGFVRAPSGELVGDVVDYAQAGDLLPPVLDPAECAGELRSSVGARLGLPAGVRVAVGWSDLYAALLAAGALDQPERAFDITGTAEGIGTSSRTPVEADGLVSTPVMPVLAITYGSTQAGCGAVDWWLRTNAWDPALSPEAMDELVTGVMHAPPRVVFLPHLGGERAPLWDTSIRGAFLGLDLTVGWVDLARAVLEGVAYSVRHVLELADSAAPSRGPVRVAGPAARSRVWNQIKADVLGRPIEALQAREVSSLGAGMLAGVAAGFHRSVSDLSASMTREIEVLDPRVSHVALYSDLYAIYRRAQRDLAGFHTDLSVVRERMGRLDAAART